MKKMNNTYAKALLLVTFTAVVLTACDKDDNENMPDKPDLAFYALSDNNQLIQFNAKDASSALNTFAITGLQGGEKILSIDFRPATGQLYGLGSTSRLYIINQSTGTARSIAAVPFTPAISGAFATIDFNPTVDRIRLVSNTGQNLRLNPETATVAATDGVISGVASASISEVAYTNSTAGASATVLFDLDATTDKLYRQDPPNNGTLVEAGSLNIDFSGAAGFDIAPDNSTALAALSVNNTTGLYSINLDNGSATFYNNFSGNVKITGLAIPTPPVAYAADADNNFLIFNPASTLAPVSKAITGLQAGEKIVGIDMRPFTGQLYGLGNSGRLYTFNLSSGVAAMVGLNPITLSGTDFGFDFNPTVDRIRVVSNTGQNIRLNPNDGLLAGTDSLLNPGTPAITAVAYTNNFAGASSTMLFDLDINTDKLYRQDPPNNGLLVDIGALGIDATSLNGFDIGSTSGTAYAILSVGAAAGIYTINLQTGAATKVGDFSKTVQAMSVGLGF